MPLRAILMSKATAKGSDHTALFWQLLCSHCLRGDKRPPSQPQPTTAQTNYRTGRSCIHFGSCNRTCPVLYLLLIHEKAITTKPSEWGERNDVVWCFLWNNGNMPQIPAMLNVWSISLCSILSSPKGELDITQVQLASHQCMTYGADVRWKSSKGLTVPTLRQIICSTIKGSFIDIYIPFHPHHSAHAEKMCFSNNTSSVAFSFQLYQNISIKPHTHWVYNCSFSSSFLVESEAPEESHS